MKKVVLNLSQPQYTTQDKPSVSAPPRTSSKKWSGVKNQPAAAKPSVTFEQAERDEHNIFAPQPTEFVSSQTSHVVGTVQ